MERSLVSRVHSIVRDEFENCRSWKDPRENCIVVKHVDPVAEEEVGVFQRQAYPYAVPRVLTGGTAPGRAVGKDERGDTECYW